MSGEMTDRVADLRVRLAAVDLESAKARMADNPGEWLERLGQVAGEVLAIQVEAVGLLLDQAAAGATVPTHSVRAAVYATGREASVWFDDPDEADAYARTIEGYVVELPVVADYRPKPVRKGGEA